VRPVTIDGRRLHTLRIGYGRYRGWSGAWASVSSAGNPVLKFELAYAPSVKDQRQRRLTRPLRCDAAVNGAEVWSREVKVGTKWQPVEIPLTAIKGRKAFISLSAKAMT
ncbi:MAG: hypothetical protein QF886_10815, partial [Planctomycetota bacterium]|nr:hypothetical protein [Planctomycetota bacterium]